jgi:acyl dehydratase
MPTLASLPKGYAFPATTFHLTAAWVHEYAAAVEDSAIAALGDTAVPPMAIPAYSIRALLAHAALPGGAIHISQEMEYQRAVQVGEQLVAEAQVASRREVQGWVLMAVDLRVHTGGEPVMTGRATVTFPVDGTAPA